MKRIKNFNDFLLENNINDIKLDINDLLDIINDNELNLYTTLKIDDNIIKIKDDISKLYNDSTLNKSLKKKGLEKGKLHDTKFIETLLDDNYVLKFFFIYDKPSIEIEEPEYIILQYYNKNKDKNSDIRIFDNKDSINEFYELLTNKTIKIEKGNNEYIYKTSNSGNNWELKNPNKINKTFKKSIDKEELNNILKDKKIKYDVK